MLAEGGDAERRAADDPGAPRRPPRRASRRGARPCSSAPPSSGTSSSGEALAELAPDRRRPSRRAARGARAQGADPPARGDRGHLPLPPHAHPRRRLRAHPEGAPLRAARALRRLARAARGEEFEEIVGYHLEQAYRCLAELGPPGERAQASPRGPRSCSPRPAGERTRAATCRRPRTCSSAQSSCFLTDDGRRLTSPAASREGADRVGSAGAGAFGPCGGSRERASDGRPRGGRRRDGRALPPPVSYHSERGGFRGDGPRGGGRGLQPRRAR